MQEYKYIYFDGVRIADERPKLKEEVPDDELAGEKSSNN